MNRTITNQENGQKFELKYSIKSLQKIENILGISMFNEIYSKNAMFSITQLQIIIGYAVFNSEGNKISPEQGADIAMDLIENVGYKPVIEWVANVMKEDLGFLFRQD
ncbi:MAG TPA: hypothetical protein IAC41_09080 [Candidatus Merdenecus merdavium]|nr:hypothetical protein [Candidatus Merdenecus merdavium]